MISLISAQELKARLDGNPSNLCIIDSRSRAEFNMGRIPGAIWMGWEDWCSSAPDHLGPMLKQPGYWGEMVDIDHDLIGKQLALLGLSNTTDVVVYADGAKSKGREGRIAWMLLYLGAKSVRILDGGITAWTSRHYPTVTAIEAITPGAFNVELHPERRMTIATLREALSKKTMPVMLDTRTTLEHIGDLHRYMPRRGRIPDSELIQYPSIFNADGTFVDRETFMSLLPDRVTEADEVVVYCEVGARACMVALLHEVHTGQILPVYDGSMMQWCCDPDLPVEKISRDS
jgi:thiosulfate/3-mercaptopyruvate sulfurtransferase